MGAVFLFPIYFSRVLCYNMDAKGANYEREIIFRGNFKVFIRRRIAGRIDFFTRRDFAVFSRLDIDGHFVYSDVSCRDFHDGKKPRTFEKTVDFYGCLWYNTKALQARCEKYAGVAELADAPDLGSGVNRRGGSSPFARTK